MPLYWMEDGKKAIDLPKSRKIYYLSICRKLKKIGASEDILFDYVTDVVNTQCESDKNGKIFFRPGFTFNKSSIHWDEPRPLSKLWLSKPYGLKLEQQDAGNFLGLLVYKYMLASEEAWYCTKTLYNNRAFDTMVYWKDNK